MYVSDSRYDARSQDLGHDISEIQYNMQDFWLRNWQFCPHVLFIFIHTKGLTVVMCLSALKNRCWENTTFQSSNHICRSSKHLCSMCRLSKHLNICVRCVSHRNIWTFLFGVHALNIHLNISVAWAGPQKIKHLCPICSRLLLNIQTLKYLKIFAFEHSNIEKFEYLCRPSTRMEEPVFGLPVSRLRSSKPRSPSRAPVAGSSCALACHQTTPQAFFDEKKLSIVKWEQVLCEEEEEEKLWVRRKIMMVGATQRWIVSLAGFFNYE